MQQGGEQSSGAVRIVPPEPKVSFPELVRMMVEADLARVERGVSF